MHTTTKLVGRGPLLEQARIANSFADKLTKSTGGMESSKTLASRLSDLHQQNACPGCNTVKSSVIPTVAYDEGRD